MTLREMMIERLNYSFTEEQLQEAFDYTDLEGDLFTISDEDFLDLYDAMYMEYWYEHTY